MNTRLRILLICLLVALLSAQIDSHKIIGYFTAWSVYGRDYHITDIPAEKITHINYAFANIAGGEIVLGDAYADIDKFYEGDSWDVDSLRGNFHQLIILKESHPHIKTFISVGGYTWSTQFPACAMTTTSRQIFARSCIDFVDEYQFDGVDIDWEYPALADKHNYTLLMAELRRQLDSLGSTNGNEYLLTIAAPAGPERFCFLEVDSLAHYLDWINIMTYDYHGAWGGEGDAYTNFNAALHTSSGNPLGEPFFSLFNQSATVDTFLSLGLPREQLVLGLPFYGRGFGNVVDGGNGLYAAYSGAPGIGTWENGSFDFDDLYHNYIDMAGYTRYWHDEAKVPWLYNPSSQIMISYDDTMSIAHKTRFILSENLGGAMFWEFSCDEDDMLLSKVFDVISSGSVIVENDIVRPEFLSILAYPNPFNSAVNITIPRNTTKIAIHDLKGHLIFQSNCATNEIIWKPKNNVRSGVYCIKTFGENGQKILDKNVLYIK